MRMRIHPVGVAHAQIPENQDLVVIRDRIPVRTNQHRLKMELIHSINQGSPRGSSGSTHNCFPLSLLSLPLPQSPPLSLQGAWDPYLAHSPKEVLSPPAATGILEDGVVPQETPHTGTHTCTCMHTYTLLKQSRHESWHGLSLDHEPRGAVVGTWFNSPTR